MSMGFASSPCGPQASSHFLQTSKLRLGLLEREACSDHPRCGNVCTVYRVDIPLPLKPLRKIDVEARKANFYQREFSMKSSRVKKCKTKDSVPRATGPPQKICVEVQNSCLLLLRSSGCTEGERRGRGMLSVRRIRVEHLPYLLLKVRNSTGTQLYVAGTCDTKSLPLLYSTT